jgi:hypothetical protein
MCEKMPPVGTAPLLVPWTLDKLNGINHCYGIDNEETKAIAAAGPERIFVVCFLAPGDSSLEFVDVKIFCASGMSTAFCLYHAAALG